jgi:hypothetical protein
LSCDGGEHDAADGDAAGGIAVSRRGVWVRDGCVSLGRLGWKQRPATHEQSDLTTAAEWAGDGSVRGKELQADLHATTGKNTSSARGNRKQAYPRACAL